MGVTMAFPADWRGRLARAIGWVVGLVFVFWIVAGVAPTTFFKEQAGVAAGRIQAFFVANDLAWFATNVAGGVGIIRGLLRFCVAAIGLPLALVIMRFSAFWLPTTPVLLWRTLWFRTYGRRYRLSVYEIRTVFVEYHPAAGGEFISLELRDGRTLPLCPLEWSGAPRLYRALLAAKRGRRSRRSGRVVGS
jgi:hypothetical protein